MPKTVKQDGIEDRRSGLLGQGQGLSVRSLSMSVYQVLLAQIVAIRFYLALFCGADEAEVVLGGKK